MKKLIGSLTNSYNGLRSAWTEDNSFRYTSYQLILAIILAFLLKLEMNLSWYAWLLLVGSYFPVLIVETINTSIEAVTDKASPERHPLAKKAKDIGSAAVMLTRFLACLCWLVVLIENLH